MMNNEKERAVDGVVAKSDIDTIFVKPGRGKSWVALAIAVSIASGKPCLGLLECEANKGVDDGD